ncbi:MAG TPA: MFS transporter [Actinomycetota bacterium]|nr:MFS transporter [Actinomycetota bacterium]
MTTENVQNEMDEEAVTPKATRREWVGLGVIALACVLYVMDLTVLHLAIPEISEDLRPTSAQLLWIIDIYGFVVAGSLITMGTLGDRIGRRRLLMIGAATFGVASVLAAFSSSAEMLIATRALLGLAGATLAPSTLSLIRNMFLDPRQRQTAIAVWITSFSVGGAIGPLLGGLVLEFFWWGAAFLLAVPVMGLILVLGPRLLPEYRDPEPGRLDLLSAVMSLVAVLAMIYGLKQFAQNGVGWAPVVAIGTGLLIGLAFVRRQRHLDDPFIDLRLFRASGFSPSLAAYGVGIVIMFGGFLFLPQYLQLVLGLSPLEAGLWTLPWAVGFIVGSQLTPRLARRIPPATLMAGGMVFAAIGFAVFVGLDERSGFLPFLTGSVIFSLAMAPVFTLAIDLIVGVAPPERAGAASAIAETSAEFGGAMGIALFGSIGLAIYRSGIAEGLPAGVPADAAAVARDTLGGAVEIAGQLPDRLGAPLLDAARDAFILGIHVSALISVIGAIGLAVFIGVLLRRKGVGVEPMPEEDPVETAEPEPSAVA